MINSLLDTVYDLQASTRSPDFFAGGDGLDETAEKALAGRARDQFARRGQCRAVASVTSNAQRHLVLLTSLQERMINEVLGEPVKDFDDALRNSATHLYLADRRRAHDAIKANGVQTVDVEPEKLPVALVNRYLDIKRSGRL